MTEDLANEFLDFLFSGAERTCWEILSPGLHPKHANAKYILVRNGPGPCPYLWIVAKTVLADVKEFHLAYGRTMMQLANDEGGHAVYRSVADVLQNPILLESLQASRDSDAPARFQAVS